MRKLLTKLLLRLVVGDISNLEVSQETREKGYRDLYQNVPMMKMLDKILVEDTKEMMKHDWTKDEYRWMRVGMFIRTKALMDKAKEIYEKTKKG